jgi:hypothetical protein
MVPFVVASPPEGRADTPTGPQASSSWLSVLLFVLLLLAGIGLMGVALVQPLLRLP